MKKANLVLLVLFAMLAAVSISAREDHSANIERITVDELKAKLEKGEKITIIDVRGGDYDASPSKIRGAIRIPPAQLQARLSEIPRDNEIVTYCACSTDGGALKAAEVLLANGFKQVRALRGGWNAWMQAGGPIEPKDPADASH
jgi:rhodanese-related sulfurtransferase